MPRLDGTGPEGKGPMTGRGLGDCGVFSKDEEKAIQSITQKPSPQRPLRIRRRLNLNKGRGRRGRLN